MPRLHPFLPALLCAALLAAPALAQPGASRPGASRPAFTPKAALDSLFEVEGASPFASPYTGTLTFSALASRHATANGHGYRNELKIAARERRAAARTREHFSAVVTPLLPAGARTIVAQYHVEGLDTLVKVYVQDTLERKLLDGQAGNGVFDVLARIRGAGGKEVTTALGTLRPGESFTLDIRFDRGVASVDVDTAAHGKLRAAGNIEGETRAIYFKFGDYAQALDPQTGKPTSDPARWDAWFRQQRIDKEAVRFEQVVFERS